MRASDAAMVSMPHNATWLTGFAAQLLQLKPELSAIEAVRIADQQYEKVSRLDPAKAAETYVKESAAND